METTRAKKQSESIIVRTPEELLSLICRGLNEKQLAAVMHDTGPAAVAGVPGSGKTRVLIARLLKLYTSGVRPDRICATTFSKAAAAEIEKRLKKMGASTDLRVGTLHSVAYEIVRAARPEFGGYYNVDASGQLHFILKEIVDRELKAEGRIDIRALEEWIELAKVSLLPVREGFRMVGDEFEDELTAFAYRHFDDTFNASIALQAYHRLEARRSERCLMSFGDMLLGACLALKDTEFRDRCANRYDHVLLDEAHDSNIAQLELVKALSEKHKNVMVYHSVSQAIYGWRGAQPALLLEWIKDFTHYNMPYSYRCNKRIAEAASSLVAGADWNIEGPIVSVVKEESPRDTIRTISCIDQRNEAATIVDEIKSLHETRNIPYASFALLYRTTALLLEPELAFLRRNIPYRVLAGSSFFSRKEVSDMLGYLRVATLKDPTEANAVRITNAPFRYISKSIIESAQQIARGRRMAYLDALLVTSMHDNQRSRANSLIATIKTANAMIVKKATPEDVISYIIRATNFIGWLNKAEGSGGPDSEAPKAAYIYELMRFSRAYNTVPEFIDAIDDFTKNLKSARRSRKADYVTLSTLHSSKGLEFDRVYIIGCADGLMPHCLNPDQDEERRLLYVGVTRARTNCVLSWPRVVSTPRGIVDTFESLYIKKMRGVDRSD